MLNLIKVMNCLTNVFGFKRFILIWSESKPFGYEKIIIKYKNMLQKVSGIESNIF